MMIKIPAYVTNAIGELPIDWSLEKIEELAYFQEGPGLRQWQYRDSGIPFLNIRCIKTNGTIDFTSVQYLDENEVQKKYSHFLLNENDTVISSSGTLGKIAVIKKSHLPLLLNTSIIRFVSLDENKLDNKFMRFLLESKLFSKQYRFLSQGSAQANFGPTHLKQMYFPNAPILEQQKIASILSSVDEAIEKTENIKTQTQVVKKGLMHQLLSRGIGKNECKDTIIGEVPFNWNVLFLEQIASLRKEKFNPNIEAKELKYIGLEHINQGTGTINSVNSSHKTTSMKNKFYKDDVLFSKLRPYLKKYWYADCEGACGLEILPIVANEKVLPKFLYYLLSQDSFIDEISSKTFGTRMPRTSWNDLKNYQFAIPPLGEQEKIIKIFESYNDKLTNESRYIKDLILIKQGLMQQLLTGKVRVPMNENEEVPQ